MGGCAHGLSGWIVNTRDQQGARSLESQRFKDAAHAFHLALQIAPDDTRAREGFVEAESDLAETYYQNSQFQEALATLEQAKKVDPLNVRIAGLAADISGARLKSEIVESNYSKYRTAIESLLKGYQDIKVPETEVAYRLKRFGYTYDTADLTKAIRSSSDLQIDVTKLTSHLTQLRTQVTAGSVLLESGGSAPAAGSGSLLPIP